MSFSLKKRAAIAVLALLSPLSVPQAAAAAVPETIPLTITNNSGRGEALWIYVLGESLTTHRLGYADAAGRFREWNGGSIPPSPAPDVSIPGPANGQAKTIRIPKLSGRVYFSFGQKIRFFLTPTGLVQPAPWNPSDPNRDILFDWSEYTLNDAGLWLNSSQVDMFSVPHAVGVKNAAGAVKSTGHLVANGRNRLLDAIKNQPGGWARLIHTRSDGLRVRALAPGKGIDAGLLSPTIMDGYITRAWDAYRTRTLTVRPFRDRPDVRFHGRTQGDAMVFTDGSGRTVATFAKPSTANVFGCDGRLHAPNDDHVGPIARTLCAALNRSTLERFPTQPTTDASQFYQDPVTNHYARAVHHHMVDGKAYAFPFDDVGGFESLVHDANPAQAYITLTPF
ncbi:glycoside hydrolase family 64 protein [Thermoactinospora rubra]|uniref:glycoside hydrolase family 64 protein n=1 Tax=Thermoactinospora rubra TaxID=1088767 RepID=UPI000A0F9B51|nr:glycoside hydrolase family 64 protein [Thermoactinospora rubra]